MRKLLRVVDLRYLEKQVLQGVISYSKKVEIINKSHEELMKYEVLKFYEWMKDSKYIKYESGYRNFFEGLEGSVYSIEQLYEQFKKEQDGSNLL